MHIPPPINSFHMCLTFITTWISTTQWYFIGPVENICCVLCWWKFCKFTSCLHYQIWLPKNLRLERFYRGIVKTPANQANIPAVSNKQIIYYSKYITYLLSCFVSFVAVSRVSIKNRCLPCCWWYQWMAPGEMFKEHLNTFFNFEYYVRWVYFVMLRGNIFIYMNLQFNMMAATIYFRCL